MKKMPFLLILIALFLCGCTKMYTEEQVNSTVVAKIKEVAGMQKVNVTVETVIVKETVIVTQTNEPDAPAAPAAFSSPTPLPFAQLTPDDLTGALDASGIAIRRFYFDVPSEELGPMKTFSAFASPMNLLIDNAEYEGIVYSFDSAELMQKGYDYLTAEKPGVTNESILTVKNLMLELEKDMPAAEIAKIRDALKRLE